MIFKTYGKINRVIKLDSSGFQEGLFPWYNHILNSFHIHCLLHSLKQVIAVPMVIFYYRKMVFRLIFEAKYCYRTPSPIKPVSYTHLDVYKRHIIQNLNFYTILYCIMTKNKKIIKIVTILSSPTIYQQPKYSYISYFCCNQKFSILQQ